MRLGGAERSPALRRSRPAGARLRGGYDVEVAVVDWIEHATEDPYAPARHVLLLAETSSFD